MSDAPSDESSEGSGAQTSLHQMTGTPFEPYGNVFVDTARVRREFERAQWKFVDTVPDGNCWFRACSQALYGDEECHSTLRAEVATRVRVILEHSKSKSKSKSDSGFAFTIPHGVVQEDYLQALDQMGSSIEGQLPCMATADVLGLDMQVWYFTELKGQLESSDSYHFIGSSAISARRCHRNRNLRQWHVFNHRDHERGWTPDSQNHADVYVSQRGADGQWSWVTGSVRRVIPPHTLLGESQYEVELPDGANTVTVRQHYLHKRHGNDLRASGIHFSSLVKQWEEPGPGVKKQVLRHVGVASTSINVDQLYKDLETARRTSYEHVIRFRLQNGGNQAFSKTGLCVLLRQRGKKTDGTKHMMRSRVRSCIFISLLSIAVVCLTHPHAARMQLAAVMRDDSNIIRVPSTVSSIADTELESLQNSVGMTRQTADQQIRTALSGDLDGALPDPCTLTTIVQYRGCAPKPKVTFYSGGAIRSLNNLSGRQPVVQLNTVASDKDTVRRLACEYGQQKRRRYQIVCNRCVGCCCMV